MQALKILQVALSLLPSIIEIVREVERLFPQAGAGAKKLEMTRELLETSYKTAGDVGVAFEQVWPTLCSGISAVVSVFNSTGVFRNGGESK